MIGHARREVGHGWVLDNDKRYAIDPVVFTCVDAGFATSLTRVAETIIPNTANLSLPTTFALGVLVSASR